MKSIYFGSDQEGYDIKKEIIDFLNTKGYSVVDLGVFKNDDMGYEQIEAEVAEKVAEKEDALGVVVFGKQGDGDEGKGAGEKKK